MKLRYDLVDLQTPIFKKVLFKVVSATKEGFYPVLWTL